VTISDGFDAGDCSKKTTDCSESLRSDPALGYTQGDRSEKTAGRARPNVDGLDAFLQMPNFGFLEAPQDGQKQPDPKLEQERKAQIQLWAHVDQLIDQMPAGETVDQSKFDQVFGEKAAMLRLAGLESISRGADKAGIEHVTLSFHSDKAAENGDYRLVHGKQVEFDFDPRANELSHVTGLTAGKHYIWWHDATIDSVKISHDAKDNTVFVGSGRWGIISGTSTLIIGHNGQVVPLKKNQTVADAVKQVKD
jgi:hypothetical protein